MDVKFQKMYDEINKQRESILSGAYEPSGAEVNFLSVFFFLITYNSSTSDMEERERQRKFGHNRFLFFPCHLFYYVFLVIYAMVKECPERLEIGLRRVRALRKARNRTKYVK